MALDVDTAALLMDQLGNQTRLRIVRLLVRAGEEQEGVLFDSATGLVFVRVPAGSFEMGSEDAEAGANEKPVHVVELGEGYWLGKYAVTNGEYRRFLEDRENGDVERPEHWNDAEYNGEDQPVVGVSWEEAQRYCRWAGCRLPAPCHRGELRESRGGRPATNIALPIGHRSNLMQVYRHTELVQPRM